MNPTLSTPDPSDDECRTRRVSGTRWSAATHGQAIRHAGTLSGAFNSIRDANFTTARIGVFHYALIGHFNGFTHWNGRPSGGNAAGSGADAFIGLGQYTFPIMPTNTQLWHAQTSVVMHELGHTLNLDHGGYDALNGKPNYLSIMNYNFGGVGLIVGGTIHENYDYSRLVLDAITEADLNEAQALGPDTALLDQYGRAYGTIWKCMNNGGVSSYMEGVAIALDARQNVDWDCSGTEDGVTSPPGTCVDFQDNGGADGFDQQDANECSSYSASVQHVNVNGRDVFGAVTNDESFTSYNDWDNVDFGFQEVGGYASAAHGFNPRVAHVDVLEITDVLADLDGDDLLDSYEPYLGPLASRPIATLTDLLMASR